MLPLGELQNAVGRCREPSHLWKGRSSSHLDTPVGVRQWRTLTDNGYLMSGLMQIKPEYALSVPSGFAFKPAVNGAGRLV